MREPGIYWVRRWGSEKWSVAELRGDRWGMFGAAAVAQEDVEFAEIGEQVTIPSNIESRALNFWTAQPT